jgi:sarcosine oxidase subunit alpha
MEFARQCLWPGMDVQLVSVTDAWAQIAVAGPNARRLLRRIVDPPHDLSNQTFPFMACGAVTVCGGLGGRLFRISFSGELAYELAVPARYGNALMDELLDRGADLGATPYGTEALGVLRIEKGHAAGNELNGRTTAAMLGLGRMVSGEKDSIGAVLSRREGLAGDDRRLAGFVPLDGTSAIPGGAHLLRPGARAEAANVLGWISSAAFSPTLDSPIALGFVALAGARMGATLSAASPVDGRDILVRVVSPHFVDPDGGRLRG